METLDSRCRQAEQGGAAEGAGKTHSGHEAEGTVQLGLGQAETLAHLPMQLLQDHRQSVLRWTASLQYISFDLPFRQAR